MIKGFPESCLIFCSLECVWIKVKNLSQYNMLPILDSKRVPRE
jgi:hypothetical protein